MASPWDRRSDKERERATSLLLSSWLPAVADFSPYWSDRVRRENMDAVSFVDLDALRRLAPVRELDIQHAGGEGAPALLMRPTLEQVKARATGTVLTAFLASIRRDGTDGARRALLTEYKPIHVHRGGAENDLAIGYSRSDLDRLHRCGARAAAVLGLDDSDYLVSAVPAGPNLDFFGVYHLALGASMLALHPRGHGDPLERIIDSFALIPATAVAVHPAEAIELARLLGEADANTARVDTVILVGPPPRPEQREEIVAAWRDAGADNGDLTVRSLFAPPEGRALWAEDAAGGLVTYPDLEVLEVIEPSTLEPTAGPGELVYTSAGWHGTALLRFRTGVYVDGLVDEEASGRFVPRLVGQVVPHAWQLSVSDAKDGTHVLDLRGMDSALADLPVTAWRVEVRGPTSRSKGDRFMVQVAGTLDEELLVEIEERLAAQTGVWPAKVAQATADTINAKVADDGSRLADLR